MTALCDGGGASQPRTGVTQYVTLGLELIIGWLTKGRMGVLAGAAAAIPMQVIDTAALCATDPPAWPEFELAEIAALLSPFTIPAEAVKQKYRDLVTRLAWYGLCECVAGSAPALPANPVDLHEDEITAWTGDSGLCVPARAQDVRVKNLWTGSSNSGPPSGFDSTTFNDSTWIHPPTMDLSSTFNAGGGKYGINPMCLNQDTECIPDPIAPWTTCTTPKAIWLVRWRFYLPPFDVNNLCITMQYKDSSGSGLSSGSGYINGTPGFVLLNSLSWAGQMTNFKPGWNLLVLHLNVSNTGGFDTWGTRSGLLLSASIANSARPVEGPAGCCPPDPALMVLLQQMSATLQLVQRQAVPFAYVEGTMHAGLSGAGTFAVQGILGLAVSVTTLPGRAGQVEGQPDQLFDVGWLTVGTAAGYLPRVNITSAEFVYFPPAAAGAMTIVGYTIPADVEVDILELVREP